MVAARERSGPASLAWLGADYPVQLLPQKLRGVPADWLAELAGCGAEVVLVEADDAGQRLLKAPAAHEPALPPATTLLVPVGDSDALGKPLSEEYVHRCLLLADLACLPAGSPISPEVIAVALAHPEGGLKGMPAGARAVPLLATRRPPAAGGILEETASLLLLSPHVERVVAAHLRGRPVAPRVFAS